MAKKQTRRSISVSRTTYERLKAFCESNNISMSQLVETRVNDFLGPNDVAAGAGAPMATTAPMMPRPIQQMPPSMPPLAPRAVPSGASIGASGLAPRSLDARPVSHAAPTAPSSHGGHAGHSGHPGHPGH